MKVEAIAEAIIFLCVDTNTFMLKNCCFYELSLMLDYYISKCFIVLSMKVCTCVITYAYSLFTCLQTIDYWLGITSFKSCALHYYLIKVCVGSMSLKKLSVFIVYLLEDEQELSLGMLDTSQTYL